MRPLSSSTHAGLTRLPQGGLVHLEDPALPAASVLLGPDAIEVLRPAYASVGIDVQELAIRQVLYEPETSLSVRYAATLSESIGAEDAQLWVEPVVAAVDRDGPIPGALGVTDGALTVGLYRWPHDPGLLGLVAAADPTAHPQWWATCGAELAVDVVTYRPGRRAVLRGRGTDGEAYVKVLSPRRAGRVKGRLEDLAVAGLPAPRVIDGSPELGVLVLEALPGRTLRAALGAGSSDELPDPADLMGLLDRLPSRWVGRVREVAAPSREAERHARTLLALLPDAADDIQAVLAACCDLPRSQAVPVHGDFHDDQLMIEGGQVVGLLDVDGAGVGAREDDLAAFLAHVATIALHPQAVGHRTYLDRAWPIFADAVGATALAGQTAAALLGLATGPFRAQDQDWPERTVERVVAAREWTQRM